MRVYAEHACCAHNPGKVACAVPRLCSVCSKLVTTMQTHDPDFDAAALVATGCCKAGWAAARSMLDALGDPVRGRAAAQRLLSAVPGATGPSNGASGLASTCAPPAREHQALAAAEAAAAPRDVASGVREGPGAAVANGRTLNGGGLGTSTAGEPARSDCGAALQPMVPTAAPTREWRCDMCSVAVKGADAASARCCRCAARIAAGQRHGLPGAEAECAWRAWCARGEPAPWFMYDPAHLWALADVRAVWSWQGMTQGERRGSIEAQLVALRIAVRVPARPDSWSALQWHTVVEVAAGEAAAAPR